jgi:hypothetical protein
MKIVEARTLWTAKSDSSKKLPDARFDNFDADRARKIFQEKEKEIKDRFEESVSCAQSMKKVSEYF